MSYIYRIFGFALSVMTLHASSITTSYAAQLDVYIERLNQHPQIESILAEGEASKARADAALGLPNPVISFGIDNMPLDNPSFDRYLPTAKTLGISQDFPNMKSREAYSAQHKEIERQHKLIAAYTQSRLTSLLISKLSAYQSVKAQIVLLRQQMPLYQSLEESLSGQIKAGESKFEALSEIDLQRAHTQQMLNNLHAEKSIIEAEFIRLIDEIPEQIIIKQTPNSYGEDLDLLFPLMIAAAKINIAQKGNDISAAAFSPNYGVSAVYKQREDGENNSFEGDDWVSVQGRISIPLWNKDKLRHKQKASRAEEKSARLSYDDQRRIWRQHMHSLQIQADTAQANMQLLRDKERAIGNKISAAERNYQAGIGVFSSILRAKIDRLEIQSDIAELDAQYNSVIAQYNAQIAQVVKEAE